MHNISRIIKITAGIIFFLTGFISRAGADIIYLKNGRSIKGLIQSEDEKNIVLDLGFGTMQFTQQEIERIDRSSPEDAAFIRQEWVRLKKLQSESGQRREPDSGEVELSKTNRGLVVNALLNKSVEAALILDTGASSVLLSKRIGRDLGVETAGLKRGIIRKVFMADGSQVEARLIVLDSIDVGGVEARNVQAAVLLNKDMPYDGLLGRSFLNKFNFEIDAVNKKLILKKAKPQNTLEETKYFSVSFPSDWERGPDKEKLIIFGPVLLEGESDFQRPYIIMEKDTGKPAVNSAKRIREWYARWKDMPDIKERMSKLLKGSFKNPSLEMEFISSDFQEKRDTIILGTLYFSKKYNGKVYNVRIITKDEPLKSYSLEFFCNDRYFDEYLPVFNRCIESFTITGK